jgi:hypothetical protein
MAITPVYSLNKPTVGGNDNTWGGLLNDNFDAIDTALDNAQTAADAAQSQIDRQWLDDVAAVLADTALTYTLAQPGTVAAGDIVRTRAEGFAYEVAASGASDHHVTTAGGVKLYVQAGNDGTVSTGAFASPVAAATVAGVGGIVSVPADVSAGATAPANPGASFVGERGLYFEGATGGRQLANRPGRGPDVLQWGRENLVRWLEGLRTTSTLKVALVGDSNTEGYVGAQLATYLDSLPSVSLTNFGVSGTNIEQWRTAAAPYDANSKALSDVIAYDPDLIVMCWGTNDPLATRDADDFATSLSAALTTLRASLDVNTCSIALLTPHAMGSLNDQDELWSLQIRPIIRAAAEKFVCGYYDKNGFFPNSSVDLAAGAMQNAWWDSFRVHTTALSTRILASMIAEWLTPRELWGRVWDNIPQKASADLPNTYPPGFSIARMTDGAFNGFTLTSNPISTGGHYVFQINWNLGASTSFAVRVSDGVNWLPWQTIGADALVVVTSIAAGYDVTGLFSQALNTQRTSNTVSLSGRLNVSPAAQVLTSTTLANIATTSHRPIFNIQDAEVVALNAGGTVERLRADVTTAGNIVVRATSTMADATTVSINLVYRGA